MPHCVPCWNSTVKWCLLLVLLMWLDLDDVIWTEPVEGGQRGTVPKDRPPDSHSSLDLGKALLISPTQLFVMMFPRRPTPSDMGSKVRSQVWVSFRRRYLETAAGKRQLAFPVQMLSLPLLGQ